MLIKHQGKKKAGAKKRTDIKTAANKFPRVSGFCGLTSVTKKACAFGVFLYVKLVT